MLVHINEGTVISIDKLYSMMIKYTPETSKVRCGGFFIPQYKEVKEDSWTLEIDYLSTCGNRYKFSTNCNNRGQLVKVSKSVIDQVRSFDSELLTAAFEAALLGEENGTGNSN